MMLIAYAAALGATSAPGDVRPPSRTAAGQHPIVLAQLQVQRNTIIRVRPASPQRSSKPIRWKERKAPACIPWNRLAAAMVSSPTTVDLVIRGGTRYRVKLEKSCQAIDFYSGFYVKATRDGQVCEERDSIHSRSGGQCVIDKFKTLVPSK